MASPIAFMEYRLSFPQSDCCSPGRPVDAVGRVPSCRGRARETQEPGLRDRSRPDTLDPGRAERVGRVLLLVDLAQ